MTRLLPDERCQACGGELVPPHIVEGFKPPHDADYICLRCRQAYRWTMDNPPRLAAIRVESSEMKRDITRRRWPNLSDDPSNGDDQRRVRHLTRLLDDLVLGRPTSPSCPRCAGTGVSPTGHVGSTIAWFHCQTCNHVWARRREPPTGSDGEGNG